MISSLMSGNWSMYLFQILVRVLVVFTALPLHEFAHGWVARKLGDHTAERMGRLDLNPLHHFDPFGTTMLLLTGYGWAKPVPINPVYFKNPKKGMALTALAGPVSNILLAAVLMIVYKLLYFFVPQNPVTDMLVMMFSIMISTNISLAVFNLLPCPPLDGAKIFGVFLPDRIYWSVMQYERYIMMALFGLVMFGFLDRPLSMLTGLMQRLILFLTSFVDLIARTVG